MQQEPAPTLTATENPHIYESVKLSRQIALPNLITQSLHNTAEIGVGNHLSRKANEHLQDRPPQESKNPVFFSKFMFIVIAPALTLESRQWSDSPCSPTLSSRAQILNFQSVTIRGPQPSARLSKEICLSEGSQGPLQGSAGSPRGSAGVRGILRG